MTPRPYRPRLWLALAVTPLLAACADPTFQGGIFDTILPGSEPEPVGPPPLPPQVVAALPPGAPQSIVMSDGQGCYIFSIEQNVPADGYYVRDANGNPICDAGAAPLGAPTATVAGTAPLGSTPDGQLPPLTDAPLAPLGQQ